MRIFLIVLAFLIAGCTAQTNGSTNGDPTAGMEARDGFLSLYVGANDGRVLARLPEAGEDGIMLSAIHSARLTAGLGSNPVGLDRGWGESGRVVDFRRRGDRVILEERNLRYRASSDNALERRAVAESFAPSFIASFEVEDGLIDMTDFLTSDALGLVQYLKDAEQGSFSLAADRTLVDADNVFSFPDNAEFDVFFTLESADPGREVATTAANGRTATLVVHHSFVRLPDDGYTPLEADPRSGAIEIVHYDYSAPLSAPIEKRLAVRHRITDEPITYYIDGGAPEPIRSALVEGAQWWADGFAAAGKPGAYRVAVLPEDAHPLDVRYNVVQWVHRQTRGWSYGGGVVDPRTGERLKGHVNLGSLRVRQDRMIFEGLLGADKTDSGEADDPVQLALQRIRQLSAHEVGHSLGFAHNFGASSDGKASVMDYPAPDVRMGEDGLDLSEVYGVGLGEWDLVTADWLYGDHSAAEREAILRDAKARGLSYVADRDGRGVGTANPEGSVWDNGSDPVETLRDVMAVRAYALERFGPDNLPAGRPQSDLNAAIVPIYLYHRYQTAAAAKLIGGMSFDYGPTGEADAAQIVSPERQRDALSAVLSTLDPEALDLSDAVLSRLTPRLGSFSFADSDRELFRSTAAPAFDVVAAADTASSLTFGALLHPQRAARLVEFNRRDAANPSLDDVLETTRRQVLRPASGRRAEIAQAVRTRYAYALMDLSSNAQATPVVRAHAETELGTLSRALSRSNRAENVWLSREITRFLDRPASASAPVVPAPALPPGSPIGSDCFHCD